MIRLVVNAEELGASARVNRGILRAHRTGIVTSASVLGNAADLAAVQAVAAEAPALGIGLTLTVVGGSPVARPQDVPSLLGPGGELRRRPVEVAIAWARDAIVPAELERELTAQIHRALDAGLTIDHLDTRGHLGFVPGIGQIVEGLARRYRIPGLRSAAEPPTLGWLADPRRGLEAGVLAGMAWLTRRRLGALRHGPRTWGYFEEGRLDEVRILEIVGRLEAGAHEIICHPIEGEDEEMSAAASELRALTAAKVRKAITRRGITLCTWRELF
jgi:predicted glycoside hydrolase/deacetylase ChbG (UPF0249 family)